MSLIDKLGRKTLLLIGSVGMTFCLCGVAAVFFTHTHAGALVWLLVAYIAFFSVSQGAVIWVYIAEVFPNRVRSKGQSLGSSSHWIMNAIISLIFPVLAKYSGGLPFRILCGHDDFAVLCCAVCVSGNERDHAGATAAQARHCVDARSSIHTGRAVRLFPGASFPFLEALNGGVQRPGNSKTPATSGSAGQLRRFTHGQ